MIPSFARAPSSPRHVDAHASVRACRATPSTRPVGRPRPACIARGRHSECKRLIDIFDILEGLAFLSQPRHDRREHDLPVVVAVPVSRPSYPRVHVRVGYATNMQPARTTLKPASGGRRPVDRGLIRPQLSWDMCTRHREARRVDVVRPRAIEASRTVGHHR